MGYDNYTEHRVRIKNREKYYGSNFNQYEDHSYDSYYSDLPGKMHFAVYILKRIWSNKWLRFWLILLIVVMVAIAIMILLALIPLITRIFDMVTQNGIKGILNSTAEFINKILNGFNS